MIKKLRLHNWKSYKDSELFIDPLTIIIGTNASGKSNALDALLFLNRISNGYGLSQAIGGDQGVESLRGGADWICKVGEKNFELEVLFEIDKNDYLYSIKVSMEGTKALILSEKLEYTNLEGRNINGFYTVLREDGLLNIPTYFYAGKSGEGEKFDLNRNLSILYQAGILNLKKKDNQDIIKAILQELQGIFVLDPITPHMRGYSALSEKLMTDASNIAGVLAALDDETRKSTEKRLTYYLKQIPEKDIERIWTEKIGTFKTDAMLYCEEEWKKGKKQFIDARGMSDGTLRFLAIVTALLVEQSATLLVIEEVDNGLHPSRAHVLLEILKQLGEEKGIDIIITTHNPSLLNSAGVEMIPFITVANRNEEGDSQLTLLEDIDDLPKLISVGNIGTIVSSGQIEIALERKENK